MPVLLRDLRQTYGSASGKLLSVPDSRLHSPEETSAVISVSSLNKMARSLLESNFPAVAVEGELSNFATPASGHWYFTLKDKNSQLRCAMFAGRNRLLRFRPKDGDQLVVRGRLSIYEGRGDYQLIADSMEEAGDGALRRAFEELKQKLQTEGLFDTNHKQAMDSRFQHIGIITSATGAAIRDITSVFNRRFPATRLTLFPVSVQGKDAPGEIVRAISLANRLRDKLRLQALIVGRGGGSLEDLQAFNEESVARAVFASELPVTSAVGHEVDFTISDFVADLRAPTPSAAAELMCPDQNEYQQLLLGLRQQFRNSAGIAIRQRYQSLDWLQKRMKRPDRRLQEHAQTLDRLDNQLQRSLRSGLREKRAQLDSQRRALLSGNPRVRLQASEQRLKSLQQRMAQSLKTRLSQGQAQLQAISRNLNAVSPLAVLSRGYSISYNEAGQVLRSASQLKTGSKLVTRLAGATVDSKVTRVEVFENGTEDKR